MILYFLGIMSVIVSIIIGLFSGSFWLFILALAGGVIVAVILCVLAILMERQETILHLLNEQGHFLKGQFGTLTKICPNCHYEYDAVLSSCPRCGVKN